MLPSFKDMKVPEQIIEALKNMGIAKPMPVQAQAIPALYAGRDVIARAQTGTGKTESAVKVLAVTGGRDFELQKHKLENTCHVLIGTPGRLLDHIRKGNVSLGGVGYFVLDEVDEMLKQGFVDDAAELLGMTASGRQVMLCSATLSEEVQKLGRRITTNPVLIDINPNEATVDTIKQICIKTTDEYRDRAVASLIDRLNPYLMIIFCMSKERANALGDVLGGMGYNVDVLTGELSQAKRKTVMKKFRDAKLQILVASDIAARARGLDIEGVTHVINYDIPHDVDWYVHRIGRTGRAGNEGVAITLYTADEVKWLRNIESKLNVRMEKQNLEGKVIARREQTSAPKKKKPAAPKRGRSAVADKRKAPKTGSNRRQKRK